MENDTLHIIRTSNTRKDHSYQTSSDQRGSLLGYLIFWVHRGIVKKEIFILKTVKCVVHKRNTRHKTHLSSSLNSASSILFCTTSYSFNTMRDMGITRKNEYLGFMMPNLALALHGATPKLHFSSTHMPGPHLGKLHLPPQLQHLYDCRLKILSKTTKKGLNPIYFLFFFYAQALAIEREDNPCRSLTNPKKLSFPSECLIQSWRTTWTGMFGLRPSSCYTKESWVSIFPSLHMVQIKLKRTFQLSMHKKSC